MVAKRQRKKGNPAKSDAFTAGKKRKRQRKSRKSPKSDAFTAGKKQKRQRKKGNPAKSVAFTTGKKRKRQEVKKATKIEGIPKIRCPTHAFPKKAGSEKAPKQQGSRTEVRLPCSISSQQLLLTIFFQNLLNSLGWIQQVCDG